MRTTSSLLAVLALIVGVVSLPATALADESPDSPLTVVVGQWDSTNNCVQTTYSPDLSLYNYNTLPNEWAPYWPQQALNSGAALVRTNAYYKLQYPDGSVPACGGGSVSIDIDTAEQNYIDGSFSSLCNQSTSECNAVSNAIDPNTDASIAEGNSSLQWFSYGSCVQNETDTLANGGSGWTAIITDIYQSGSGGCGNPTWSSVTIVTNDSVYS